MQTIQTKEKTRDIYRTSRLMYIIEAALEYFISILSHGAYLAKITKTIGMKDSTTALLASSVSLGVGFQILALFISGKGSTKRWVTPVHILNQLLFTFMYVVPLIDVSSNTKTLLICVLLIGGTAISNVAFSPKIGWLMGLVDENQRGKFTAVKEMVSLLSGIIFTLIMGRVVDVFEARGDINGAFIVCGITLLGLTILHTLTLIFAKEKPKTREEIDNASVKAQFVGIFKSKNFWTILPVLIFWSIANYASTPFYSTYLIGELAFSMTIISVINMIGSITRAAFSLPIGAFADKHGFSKMLYICYSLMLVAFTVMIFTTPDSKYVYIAYSIMYAIGMAGMNSSDLNLVLDYTSRSLRVGAIAIKGLICGFTGFFTTLALTPLVDYIQKNNNTLFGIHVYAQQVTSMISALMCALALVYMLTVVSKLKRNEN